MEPELIKEILINNNIFKKPTPNPLAKFLVCGLSGYEDEKWAKHRKIVNPAFYIEKLKHMIPAMHTSCIEMINEWEMLSSEKITIEIDVKPYLEDLTSDVISRTAFGSSYAQGKRIFRLQKEQAELTRRVLQSVYIPGWRFLPTKRNRRMKEINNQLRTLLEDIINQKQKAIKAGKDSADDDLLGILLKINLKEIKEQGNHKLGMSIDEVTMVLYEVLRLYPPAIIFTRIIYKETKLGEMTLPPGLQFMLPIILLHHDKQLWGKIWGPRICIGNNFALMEAKIALAMILRRFSFELSPSYTHAPSFVSRSRLWNFLKSKPRNSSQNHIKQQTTKQNPNPEAPPSRLAAPHHLRLPSESNSPFTTHQSSTQPPTQSTLSASPKPSTRSPKSNHTNFSPTTAAKVREAVQPHSRRPPKQDC
ncbi:Cytochrome [Abeliophyllum distichum]|uniref:Cytochrome n=1 Tax=Abeliophyllum distichum TaxID=126358 RepID=A0ABD1PT31_9LAMI